MKKGLLLVIILLLSIVSVAAQEIVFEPVDVGSISRQVLSNGDVVVKLSGVNITRYNPQDVKRIYPNIKENGNSELELIKGSGSSSKIIATLSGHIKVKNKVLFLIPLKTKSSIKKKSRPYVQARFGDYNLTGKKINLTKTSAGDLLFSSIEIAKGTTQLGITETIGNDEDYSILRCRDKTCKFDLFNRLSTRNRNKYVLNITGNAYWVKKNNSDMVKKGRNFVQDINITDITDIKFFITPLYMGMQAKAVRPKSSFGKVKLKAEDVGLAVQNYRFVATDKSRSFYLQYPSIIGKDITILENKAGVIFLNNSIGSVTTKGIVYMGAVSKPILELKKGTLNVFTKELPVIYDFMSMEMSAIKLKDPVKISLKKKSKYPTVLKFYSNFASSYKYLDFRLFDQRETSYAFMEKNSKIMVFKKDKVSVSSGSKWTDFGISYKIPLLNPGLNILSIDNLKEKIYSILECKYNSINPQQSVCYLNGKAISRFTQQHLKRCKNNRNCPTGENCIAGVCVKKSQCKKLNIRGMNGPIGLVFVNDGAVPTTKFKNEIMQMLGISDGSKLTPSAFRFKQNHKLFEKEPFKSLKNKFTIYYVDDANLPLGSIRGSPALKISKIFAKKMCPQAKHLIVISQHDFGSIAVFDGRVYLSKKDLLLTQNALSHEYAHACCKTADEYAVENSALNTRAFLSGNGRFFFNCANTEANARTKGWPSNIISQAKSSGWKGCGGNCPVGCKNWLKPSANSIMSMATTHDTFNSVTQNGIKNRLLRIR